MTDIKLDKQKLYFQIDKYIFETNKNKNKEINESIDYFISRLQKNNTFTLRKDDVID